MIEKNSYLKLIEKGKYEKVNEQILEELSLFPEKFDENIEKLKTFYEECILNFYGDFIYKSISLIISNFGEIYFEDYPLWTDLKSFLNKMNFYLIESIGEKIEIALKEKKTKKIIYLCQKILNLTEPFENSPSEEKIKKVKILAKILSTNINLKIYIDEFLPILIKKLKLSSFASELNSFLDENWKNFYQSGIQNKTLSHKVYLNDLITSANRFLPSPNEFGEPTEENFKNFKKYLSFLFTSLFLNNETKNELYFAIGKILVEFNPRPVSEIAKTAGIENRFYYQLGLQARRTVNRTFKQLSQIKRLDDFFKYFTKLDEKDEKFALAVEIIGMLRNEKYLKYLMKIVKRNLSFKYKYLALLGISRIPSENGIKFLYEYIKNFAKKKNLNYDDKLLFAEMLQSYFKIIALPTFPSFLKNKYLTKFYEIEDKISETYITNTYMYLLQYFEDLPEHFKEKIIIKLILSVEKKLLTTVNIEKSRELVSNIFKILQQNIESFYNATNKYLSSINLKPSTFTVYLLDFIAKNPSPKAENLLEKLYITANLFFNNNLSIYQTPIYFDEETNSTKPLTRDFFLNLLLQTVLRVLGEKHPLYSKIVINKEKETSKHSKIPNIKTLSQMQDEELDKKLSSSNLTELDKKRLAFLQRKKEREKLLREKRNAKKNLPGM